MPVAVRKLASLFSSLFLTALAGVVVVVVAVLVVVLSRVAHAFFVQCSHVCSLSACEQSPCS